LRGLRYTAF